jgi:hypothetical protein
MNTFFVIMSTVSLMNYKTIPVKYGGRFVDRIYLHEILAPREYKKEHLTNNLGGYDVAITTQTPLDCAGFITAVGYNPPDWTPIRICEDGRLIKKP